MFYNCTGITALTRHFMMQVFMSSSMVHISLIHLLLWLTSLRYLCSLQTVKLIYQHGLLLKDQRWRQLDSVKEKRACLCMMQGESLMSLNSDPENLHAQSYLALTVGKGWDDGE